MIGALVALTNPEGKGITRGVQGCAETAEQYNTGEGG